MINYDNQNIFKFVQIKHPIVLFYLLLPVTSMLMSFCVVHNIVLYIFFWIIEFFMRSVDFDTKNFAHIHVIYGIWMVIDRCKALRWMSGKHFFDNNGSFPDFIDSLEHSDLAYAPTLLDYCCHIWYSCRHAEIFFLFIFDIFQRVEFLAQFRIFSVCWSFCL